MHVLVVENDLDTRDLIYQALTRAGYRVSQATGLSDALRLSRLYPDIGVVVADMRLGRRISGIDMACEMRCRLYGSHYILASVDWDALESHCPEDVSLLRKPYGRAELLRAVRYGAIRHAAKALHAA